MTITIPRPPHRLERLRAWLDDNGLDCCVVFGADNVTHLCGYARYFGGASALVVGRDGERTLLVMQDEVRIAREHSAADHVVGYGRRGFGIDLDPVAALVSTLAAQAVVARSARVGLASEIADAGTRLGRTLSATLVDAAPALARIRLIKDWDELERIGAGYHLCWLAQDAVARAAVAGVSEIELFSTAQATAQIASGGPIEFVCDLLSGPNTAEVCCPIHVAGRRTVAAGDAIVADIVVRTNGYWGDSAETHIAGASDVAGASDEVAAARGELLRILERARAHLVPGATGADVFSDLSADILATFPGGEFPHHGGHALGLTSFEDPHLIPSDTMPFEPWMVLAVEPGVYYPGRLGARVENVFVVTPAGGVELRLALAGADGAG